VNRITIGGEYTLNNGNTVKVVEYHPYPDGAENLFYRCSDGLYRNSTGQAFPWVRYPKEDNYSVNWCADHTDSDTAERPVLLDEETEGID
jgi:hypothetical protein